MYDPLNTPLGVRWFFFSLCVLCALRLQQVLGGMSMHVRQ